jgi:hypothetical protein
MKILWRIMTDAWNSLYARYVPGMHAWKNLCAGCAAIVECRVQLIELISQGDRTPESILAVSQSVLSFLLDTYRENATQLDRDQLCQFVRQRILESEDFPRSPEEFANVISRWLAVTKITGYEGQFPLVPPKADAN